MNALAYEFTGLTDELFSGKDTLHERAIALTTWAVRHGRLAELLQMIQEKRS
jgi:hypothetical protein